MKILVTVGTTKFDSLIFNVDNYAKEKKEIDFTFQISDDGEFKPENGTFFSFSERINDLYDLSDIIITHAGAGSIYKLLEMRKKLIIVPNFERVDKHQVDIADFMESNKYALVCSNVVDIGKFIEKSLNTNLVPFNKTPFFKEKEIAKFILG